MTWQPPKHEENKITDLYFLEFQKFFDAGLTKFKNSKILLNKISHRFLTTAKLFIEWNIPTV